MRSPDSGIPVRKLKIARFYRGARTVHLERLSQMATGDFLYYKPMYDFDQALADSLASVTRVKFRTVLWRVLRVRYDVLELAEPYTPSALPQNLALASATVLTSLLLRRHTRLVTYAIENSDLSKKLAAMTRVPQPMIKPIISGLVGFCYGRFDRVVFGTSAAYENYRDLLGERRLDRTPPVHTLIWGLPTTDPGARAGENDTAPNLVFLGALDSRKGILSLMAAWDFVVGRLPDAQLTILGKGPLRSQVEEWASQRASVHLSIDPAREAIRDTLASHKALILLSQPSPLWKEQIGLPIVEALSFGLEIVASTETGISQWLHHNGHAVLEPGVQGEALALAIVTALQSRRTRADVVATLPIRDGRIEADRWLFPQPA